MATRLWLTMTLYMLSQSVHPKWIESFMPAHTQVHMNNRLVHAPSTGMPPEEQYTLVRRV